MKITKDTLVTAGLLQELTREVDAIRQKKLGMRGYALERSVLGQVLDTHLAAETKAEEAGRLFMLECERGSWIRRAALHAELREGK